MQKVSIICVGKMKEKFYIDAAAEYVKRLSRFCKLEITELPEDRLPDDRCGPGQGGRCHPRQAAPLRLYHRHVRGGKDPLQ